MIKAEAINLLTNGDLSEKVELNKTSKFIITYKNWVGNLQRLVITKVKNRNFSTVKIQSFKACRY